MTAPEAQDPRDEALKLAREAGFDIDLWNKMFPLTIDMWTDKIERLIALAHRSAAPASVESAANVCDQLAEMMEQGAGEDEPGHRLRQAARMIRELFWLSGAAPASAEPVAIWPVPEWATVPTEPTPEMLKAMGEVRCIADTIAEAYRAAIRAAPPAPPEATRDAQRYRRIIAVAEWATDEFMAQHEEVFNEFWQAFSRGHGQEETMRRALQAIIDAAMTETDYETDARSAARYLALLKEARDWINCWVDPADDEEWADSCKMLARFDAAMAEQEKKG